MQCSANAQVRQKPHRSSTVRFRVNASSGAVSQVSAIERSRVVPPTYAGCSFTAHSIFGRPGNNPYCHYRARTLAKQGLRERLVPATSAPGEPFDHGTFTLVTEPLDAPAQVLPPERLVQIRRV